MQEIPKKQADFSTQNFYSKMKIAQSDNIFDESNSDLTEEKPNSTSSLSSNKSKQTEIQDDSLIKSQTLIKKDSLSSHEEEIQEDKSKALDQDFGETNRTGELSKYSQPPIFGETPQSQPREIVPSKYLNKNYMKQMENDSKIVGMTPLTTSTNLLSKSVRENLASTLQAIHAPDDSTKPSPSRFLYKHSLAYSSPTAKLSTDALFLPSKGASGNLLPVANEISVPTTIVNPPPLSSPALQSQRLSYYRKPSRRGTHFFSAPLPIKYVNQPRSHPTESLSFEREQHRKTAKKLHGRMSIFKAELKKVAKSVESAIKPIASRDIESDHQSDYGTPKESLTNAF